MTLVKISLIDIMCRVFSPEILESMVVMCMCRGLHPPSARAKYNLRMYIQTQALKSPVFHEYVMFILTPIARLILYYTLCIFYKGEVEHLAYLKRNSCVKKRK